MHRSRFPARVSSWLLISVSFGLATIPSQAQGAPRQKLVLLISAQSYETHRTLPAFAAARLEPQFRVVIVSGAMDNPGHRFTGLDELEDADLLLISVWRRAPPKEQVAALHRYVTSGRPVVGVCTSSHAFALRKDMIAAPGSVVWPGWGAEVIGSNYTGHHPTGIITTVSAANTGDPLLDRVTLPFTSRMELNRVSPLQPRTRVLLIGAIAGQPPEPVAWTFQRGDGGRTFFTPLGHPDDFANESFQQLLLNGIRWSVEKPSRPLGYAPPR